MPWSSLLELEPIDPEIPTKFLPFRNDVDEVVIVSDCADKFVRKNVQKNSIDRQ